MADYRVVITRKQAADRAQDTIGIHEVILDERGQLRGVYSKPAQVKAGSRQELQQVLKRMEMAFLHGTLVITGDSPNDLQYPIAVE